MAKKKSKKSYNPLAYVKVKRPGRYVSKYQKQLNKMLGQIRNYKYDPMKDANYQAYAKIYGARGNLAAKDTLADAASLNGGNQTSFAVSAAQQSRNQYNQELAALVPELEANAYNRLLGSYDALKDADLTAYERFRDRIGDWQWGKSYDAGNYQWKKDFALQKSNSSGGGGGGGGGGGSSHRGGSSYRGGGSYNPGGGGGTSDPLNQDDINEAAQTESKKRYGKVHLWNDKKKVISDKTKQKEIKRYTGRAR